MADYADRSPSSGDTTTGSIKDQTRAVAESAVRAGGDVTQTAKEQGREVIAESGRQARQLYGQVRSELTDQARTQQQRVAAGLRSVADEATRIADQGGESGPVTQVVREASGRLEQAGQWLEGREPGHVLDEVKSYARRHPAVFLLGAAVLGVVAGRLAKNAMGNGADDGSAVSPGPQTSSLSTADLQAPYLNGTPPVRPVDARSIQYSGS